MNPDTVQNVLILQEVLSENVIFSNFETYWFHPPNMLKYIKSHLSEKINDSHCTKCHKIICEIFFLAGISFNILNPAKYVNATLFEKDKSAVTPIHKIC